MGRSVFAVVSDRFYGTTLHRFQAKVFFLWSRRLLKDVGIAAVVAAREIVWSRFPTEIAIDTLIVYVKPTGHIILIPVLELSHLGD
jgi:hypothetical protein